jgi:hypothetical protein
VQKQPWQGGYPRIDSKGRRTFYIERKLDGKRLSAQGKARRIDRDQRG